MFISIYLGLYLSILISTSFISIYSLSTLRDGEREYYEVQTYKIMKTKSHLLPSAS